MRNHSTTERGITPRLSVFLARGGAHALGDRRQETGRNFRLRKSSIVTAVDARPAPIAATGSHSPAPTMDGASGAEFGGDR